VEFHRAFVLQESGQEKGQRPKTVVSTRPGDKGSLSRATASRVQAAGDLVARPVVGGCVGLCDQQIAVPRIAEDVSDQEGRDQVRADA
jgi:hypothetical protein